MPPFCRAIAPFWGADSSVSLRFRPEPGGFSDSPTPGGPAGHRRTSSECPAAALCARTRLERGGAARRRAGRGSGPGWSPATPTTARCVARPTPRPAGVGHGVSSCVSVHVRYLWGGADGVRLGHLSAKGGAAWSFFECVRLQSRECTPHSTQRHPSPHACMFACVQTGMVHAKSSEMSCLGIRRSHRGSASQTPACRQRGSLVQTTDLWVPSQSCRVHRSLRRRRALCGWNLYRGARGGTGAQHVGFQVGAPVCKNGVHLEQGYRTDDGVGGASGFHPIRLRQSVLERKAHRCRSAGYLCQLSACTCDKSDLPNYGSPPADEAHRQCTPAYLRQGASVSNVVPLDFRRRVQRGETKEQLGYVVIVQRCRSTLLAWADDTLFRPCDACRMQSVLKS